MSEKYVRSFKAHLDNVADNFITWNQIANLNERGWEKIYKTLLSTLYNGIPEMGFTYSSAHVRWCIAT